MIILEKMTGELRDTIGVLCMPTVLVTFLLHGVSYRKLVNHITAASRKERVGAILSAFFFFTVQTTRIWNAITYRGPVFL